MVLCAQFTVHSLSYLIIIKIVMQIKHMLLEILAFLLEDWIKEDIAKINESISSCENKSLTTEEINL